jgi:hypothetical protein
MDTLPPDVWNEILSVLTPVGHHSQWRSYGLRVFVRWLCAFSTLYKAFESTRLHVFWRRLALLTEEKHPAGTKRMLPPVAKDAKEWPQDQRLWRLATLACLTPRMSRLVQLRYVGPCIDVFFKRWMENYIVWRGERPSTPMKNVDPTGFYQTHSAERTLSLHRDHVYAVTYRRQALPHGLLRDTCLQQYLLARVNHSYRMRLAYSELLRSIKAIKWTAPKAAKRKRDPDAAVGAPASKKRRIAPEE